MAFCVPFIYMFMQINCHRQVRVYVFVYMSFQVFFSLFRNPVIISIDYHRSIDRLVMIISKCIIIIIVFNDNNPNPYY